MNKYIILITALLICSCTGNRVNQYVDYYYPYDEAVLFTEIKYKGKIVEIYKDQVKFCNDSTAIIRKRQGEKLIEKIKSIN